MNEFTEDSLKQLDVIISTFHRIQEANRKEALKVNETLILKYKEIIEERKNFNRHHSLDLNVFKYFSLGETMHSFLLAKLLNPNAEHGQGNLFLNLFLKMLDIPNPEEGTWTVTAETGRIDILMKRSNPKTTIIIENKSNNAADQPNQLYRYWYREIFYPNRRPTGTLQYIRNNLDRYKIIYLVSNEWKGEDENSRKRPIDLIDDSLPDEIPPNWVTKWRFQKHILEWLKTALNSSELPTENYRLRNFIEQYIEVWSSN